MISNLGLHFFTLKTQKCNHSRNLRIRFAGAYDHQPYRGSYSSFPEIHNVGIFVQLLVEINWEWLQGQSILMQICIVYGPLK